MHITAHLDIDVVACDVAEDVTCLVQLTAPVNEQTASRPGQSLVIVLDRSGSMAGEPLAAAKSSITALLRRLAPQDSFGLVVFDDKADVVIPVRPMSEHDLPTLDTLVERVLPGGSTDLSAGYLLGLRELKRTLAKHGRAGATLLLVSDGHANAGLVDAAQMREIAARANSEQQVTTSTLGYGDGYDEILLEAITRGGNGNHAFAPDVDSAMHEIQAVVSGLLDKSVVAAQMRIRPQVGLVDGVRVMQDLPNWADGDAVVVNLGDLYAGEERKTLIGFHVPAAPALGQATIADIVFEYTSLPDLLEHTVTVPVAINVVSSDAALSRIPNPIVEVEKLLLTIDERKKTAAERLRSGDTPTAQRLLADAIKDLDEKREDLKLTAPESTLHERLREAAEDLLALADDVRERDAFHASKSMTDSYSKSSRGRELRKPKPNLPLDSDDEEQD